MNDLGAIFAGMILKTVQESVCVHMGPLSNPRMGKVLKMKVLAWPPSGPHKAVLLQVSITLDSTLSMYFPAPLCLLSHFSLSRIPSFPSLLDELVPIFQMFPSP